MKPVFESFRFKVEQSIIHKYKAFFSWTKTNFNNSWKPLRFVIKSSSTRLSAHLISFFLSFEHVASKMCGNESYIKNKHLRTRAKNQILLHCIKKQWLIMGKILHMFWGGAWKISSLKLYQFREKLSTRKWNGKKYNRHVVKETQTFSLQIHLFSFSKGLNLAAPQCSFNEKERKNKRATVDGKKNRLSKYLLKCCHNFFITNIFKNNHRRFFVCMLPPKKKVSWKRGNVCHKMTKIYFRGK